MKKFCYATALGLLITFGFLANLLAEDYFPLRVGQRKIYFFEEDRGSHGNVIGEMSDFIEGYVSINGKQYIKKVRTFKNVPRRDTTISYVRKTPDAVFIIPDDDHKEVEVKELLLPIKIGDAWTSEYPSGMTYKWRVQSIDDAYVGDKKYKNVVKVVYESDFKGNKYIGYNLYAPDVGVIKWYARSEDNSYVLKLELEKIEFK